MGLTKAQETLLTRARSAGSSELAVGLDDETCNYLLAVMVNDIGIQAKFPELPKKVPPFFGPDALSSLRIRSVEFRKLFERLLYLVADADTYFYCLAVLHKARLKYERILQAQPVPTIDQVGPRGLLQYGSLSPKALAGLLFWRKWVYDIDNRAAQETGYVFQPIIAYSIGGVPLPASKSPIRRTGNAKKGREVDCLREKDKRAYELKLRVTIAASGQGRWSEELAFPEDCKTSGYAPVLIVFDPTSNPKIDELKRVFLAKGGKAFIGPDAWAHLKSEAGSTMAKFLEKYVHEPIDSLLSEVPKRLPDISLHMNEKELIITVDSEKIHVVRDAKAELLAEDDEIPEDVEDEYPEL